MKNCHVCSRFRELGASYCASLREHLNKTAVSPEGGPGQQAQRKRGLRVHICARTRTHAASAPTRAERAALAPGRLHKVLGDSQSWVVISGKGRDPGLRLLLRGPLGRSGGFGLSGPRLVPSGAALGLAGVRGSPQVAACPRGSGGPAWVEVLCRSSSVLKPSASQSRENGEAAAHQAPAAGRKQGPCQALEQGPGCRTAPSHRSAEEVRPLGVRAGHWGSGARARQQG